MELTADIMGYLTQADMFQMFSFFLLFAVTMAVSYLTSSAFKADKPPPDISEIIDCGKEDLDDQVKDDKVVTVTPLLSSPGKKEKEEEDEAMLMDFQRCMSVGMFVIYQKKGKESPRFITINEKGDFCLYKGMTEADDLPKHKPYAVIPTKSELGDCFECDGSDPVSFMVEFRHKSYQFVARSVTDHEFLISGFNTLLKSYIVNNLSQSFDSCPSIDSYVSNRSGYSTSYEDPREIASVSSIGDNHIYYKTYKRKPTSWF